MEQSKEKELIDEVARLREQIENSKESELREIENLKGQLEMSKESELLDEVTSLRQQLAEPKEGELAFKDFQALYKKFDWIIYFKFKDIKDLYETWGIVTLHWVW